MSLKPKVSVISVNYNQAEVTLDMLESLRAVTWPNVEVIVVDNASPKDCSIIKEKYPEVILIKSTVNAGFAGGNNLGIKQASGDFILLLNNDTIVSPGFLEPLIDTFSRHPKAGIVSSKIIFYYTDNLVQYAGTGKISPITCRGETHGYMQKNDGRFDAEYQTQLSHGACMMISCEVIDKVGLMDDSYFMYYEEYDYCERVKRAGYEIYYNGQSSILHKQSVSMGHNSPLKSYYMTRNRISFARKNFSGISKLVSILFTYTVSIPKNALIELFSGRKENFWAIWRGSSWHFANKLHRT